MNATCRGCYAATLTPDELARFNAEPPITCVHLCDRHQAALDKALAGSALIPLLQRRDDLPHRPFAEYNPEENR